MINYIDNIYIDLGNPEPRPRPLGQSQGQKGRTLEIKANTCSVED